MAISMYTASVPVLVQMLDSLSDVLSKAEAHATEKNIAPEVFLQSRLFPDMFALVRQVQIAADFAKGIAGRLAEVDCLRMKITNKVLRNCRNVSLKPKRLSSLCLPYNLRGARTATSFCVPAHRKRKNSAAMPIC